MMIEIEFPDDKLNKKLEDYVKNRLDEGGLLKFLREVAIRTIKEELKSIEVRLKKLESRDDKK